jgi:predicted esterase
MKYLHKSCTAALVFLAACTGPSKQFDQQASMLGFKRFEQIGEGYSHTVYQNTPKRQVPELHVYLGGDGTPWISKTFIASDPTPRNPVGLRLMAIDDYPSIYLGRPCYHGRSYSADCDSILWTSARYSEQVIASMASVLRKILNQGAYQDVVLIGFSGGGTLAMHLAARFPQTKKVVTLAGNLDTDAWVKLHHYGALSGSLNPRLSPPLPAKIQQYHLAGGQDTNIPPVLIEGVVRQQHNAQLLIFDEFSHGCCWQTIWGQMLACLHQTCVWKTANKMRN